MILGVYWYFGFPDELYRFDYFTYRKGFGGHADAPAELEASIVTDNPERLIDRLRQLAERCPDAYLSVYKAGNRMLIGKGGYNLYNYDFLIAKEAENIIGRKGKGSAGREDATSQAHSAPV